MHEKLDATRKGRAGGGGEYAPQVGFGWSNGVVLDFLDRYGEWGEEEEEEGE
jgi:alpha,alpha-trehalase